ncbi:MAG: outer membrane lipoprotein-sorting protein [unclassified Hahellaceae]|nr:outer membrane lipoprotein-sorting protein [Hahellaceae bacterium]
MSLIALKAGARAPKLLLRKGAVLAMLSATALCLSSVGVQAKVPADQAKKLGTSLTPVGAEMNGTPDGVIPPWTGGITSPPANYVEGEHEADPFSQDGTRFVVTKENLDKHASVLSEGHKAMFEKHPGYTMPVYPTHRSASYPEFVYKALKKNATTAELMPRGTGVRKAITTSPFPIPQEAVEIVWNHVLRFRGEEVAMRTGFSAVAPDGTANTILYSQEYLFNYSKEGATIREIDNNLFMLKTEVLAPAKLAGTINLIHESVDLVASPRKAWRYVAGERRLRRSPYLAYDAEFPNSQGLKFIDQIDMYNGAPDQYEWTMAGKKEILIPYNAYKLHSGKVGETDIIKKGHINQDLTRYELHRVWVVEGERRTGIQHAFAKRTLYVDEDSWQVVLEEGYNEDGKLTRFAEGHMINYYTVPVPWTTTEVTYDMESGRYFVEGLDNKERPRDFAPRLKEQDFSTSAVRRDAKR